MRNAKVSFGLVALLFAGCSSGGATSDVSSSPTAAAEPSTESTVALAETAAPPTTPPPPLQTLATVPTTSLPPTTVGPTTAPGPPAYDQRTLASNLTLPSFVVTVTVANTNNGQLSENTTVSGFTLDPPSAYQLATYAYDGTTDGSRSFFINGRTYEEDPSGNWYLYEVDGPGAPDLSNGADLRSGTLSGVVSAQFAGTSDYEGIPAHHFVFNETNLSSFTSYTPENPAPAVEGDFWVAQDGNYVLYTHSKETAPNRIYEVTEALSFIGVVPPISLPPDLAPMTQALDTGVALGALLPADAVLTSMIRYDGGIGLDSYKYRTSLRSHDEFSAFYRSLPPTNGWTVTHVGHIAPHLEPINCETDVECAILTNGGEQIVVSLGAGLTIEYDHDHVFRPA